jgi:C-5 cytosine-specific DNA methylase
MKPSAIDLFCGLGGWAEGFLAEGYDCIGFDLERHDYGTGGYPGQLVIQDVLTLDGAQFREAAVIVASPPCQKYSWMAMPWSRAKREAGWQRWERDSPFGGNFRLNDLFLACFRIQREASAAAGHHIPLIVENVKGAQPWLGRAKANYGSYYLWGDVESVNGRIVRSGPVEFGMASLCAAGRMKHNPDGTAHPPGSWFAVAHSKNRGTHGNKNNGGSWFAQAHNTESRERSGAESGWAESSRHHEAARKRSGGFPQGSFSRYCQDPVRAGAAHCGGVQACRR